MKNINNNKLNYKSIYWQKWKLSQPNLNDFKNSVAIGMILSDASLSLHGKYAYLKFEQSKIQYPFIHNLWRLFNNYTFMNEIGIRYKNNEIKSPHGPRGGRSFYFKTFTHPTFSYLYNLFYINGKKTINKVPTGPHLEGPVDFILNNVNEISLAYWIMGDGSLNKRDKILTLHTESFSKESNEIISKELNEKFNLNSKVGISKSKNKIYYMIYIPRKDLNNIKILSNIYIISSMKYKINEY
jgi:hypothetical protein